MTDESPWGVPRAVRAEQPPGEIVRSERTPLIVDGKRTCPRCGEARPVEAFGFIPSGPYQGRVQSWCHDCRKAVRREQHRRNPPDPQQRKDAWLRRIYGITLAQYSWMLEVQGGVCAICGQPETKRGGRNGTSDLQLAVDHDHSTGQIRGLLCSDCNRAIGLLRHDPERLKAAIHYIEEHSYE